MLLGCKTKDEAKSDAKLNRDISADPTLNKLMSVLNMISDFQAAQPKADFIDCNITVPTSVKNMIEGSSTWKYTTTFTTVPPPQGWTGYVTTWVNITRISWL